MKFLLLLAFAITSCAVQKKPTIQGRWIASEVETYVLEFEKDYGISVDYPIFVGSLAREQDDGVCRVETTYYAGEAFIQKTIIISKSTYEWAKNSPHYLKALLYHELGHCSLGIMEHYNETIEEETNPMYGCPASLMYSSVIDWCYAYYESYYIEELRNRR